MIKAIQARAQKKDEGFTLIELLIVVLIIGILAAIVVVAVSNTQGEAKGKACSADVAALATALDTYKATSTASGGGEGSYPTSALAALSAVSTSKINGVNIPAGYKPYTATELTTGIVPDFIKSLPSSYTNVSTTWDGASTSWLTKLVSGSAVSGGIVAWYNPTLNNTIVTGDPAITGCSNSGI